MENQPNQPAALAPVGGQTGSWHWGTFLVFCVLMIFIGWLCGFLMPYWVAMIVGGMIGLVAGLCHWFDE